MTVTESSAAGQQTDSAKDTPQYPAARVVATIVLLVVGVAYLYSSLQLPLGDLSRPGPGMYPTVVACFMVLVSIAAVVQSLAIQKRASGPVAASRRNISKIAIFCASAIAMVLLLAVVGFVLSVTVLSAAVLWLMTETQLWRCLIYALAMAIVIYAAFTQMFSVRLPPLPILNI